MFINQILSYFVGMKEYFNLHNVLFWQPKIQIVNVHKLIFKRETNLNNEKLCQKLFFIWFMIF